MEDLFKQFRDNLEGRLAPPYEENDWKRMAAQLDSHKGKGEHKKCPVPFAWWWLALPMLLLLMGFNLLIFKELHNAKQKLATLETRHDTVYLERVVYRSDTIYQTRTLRGRVVEYLPARFAKNMDNAGIINEATTVNPTDKIHNETTGSTAESPLKLPNPESFPLGASPNLDFLQAPFPLLESGASGSPPENTVAQVDFEKRKTLRQILHPMIPKDFCLAANGGIVRPVGDGIVNGKGYALGLEGRVWFSPRLALWLNALYSEAAAEADKMDEALGIPTVPSPDEEFSFLSADVKYRTWQYTAGMQYALLHRHGWKGWLGAGYGAVSVRPYHVTYDYVNSANLEWPVKGQTLHPGLLDDYLLLRLGVERKLSSHLNGQLMATWRTRLGGSGLQPADLLGLQAGVVYGF